MGEALTGAVILALEAALGLGVAGLGALVTLAIRRRPRRCRRRDVVVAAWQADQQRQLTGQAWAVAWRTHTRLGHLEDRIRRLEDATTTSSPTVEWQP